MSIYYVCIVCYINHCMKKKKPKKLQNSYKIVDQKNFKKRPKKICNTVQYVCLFTTLQVENKDVCKIVKN